VEGKSWEVKRRVKVDDNGIAAGRAVENRGECRKLKIKGRIRVVRWNDTHVILKIPERIASRGDGVNGRKAIKSCGGVRRTHGRWSEGNYMLDAFTVG
jgi:hypothetical protein